MSKQRNLRTYKEQPFVLLQEMQRRARAARVGQDRVGDNEREWVGIAFRVGERPLLAARAQVREVMMLPSATPVPGAKHWVMGLANVRGQLLPLSDLRSLVEQAPSAPERNARVLAVNHRQIPAGLVVDEVYGFRRFLESERRNARTQGEILLDTCISGAFNQDGRRWPVLDLHKLVESEAFLDAAQA